ncbi:hypothetical protein CRUP_024600 [Coryphaenoides rupestris]|nr:hypothetical protein CRUP_024600 [Coryphaenoides rupestris]
MTSFLQNTLDDDDALLGSYPVDDDCRIHVVDSSGAKEGAFSDLSTVEKYEISDDAYEKKSDSVRSFMKKKRMGRYNEEEMAKKEQEEAAQEAKMEAAANAITVGTADFKPGYWVGVKYDEPLGKHDGSVNGKRYFECQNKYGAFVKPDNITVGDFPEENYEVDEM